MKQHTAPALSMLSDARNLERLEFVGVSDLDLLQVLGVRAYGKKTQNVDGMRPFVKFLAKFAERRDDLEEALELLVLDTRFTTYKTVDDQLVPRLPNAVSWSRETLRIKVVEYLEQHMDWDSDWDG